VRWPALLAGFVLVAVAFAAATRVSDTREGLFAEIVTLLGGLAGVSLLIYGLAARSRSRTRTGTAVTSSSAPPRVPRPRSRNDILLGAGGIALAIVLLGGLALSAGLWWGLLGLVLLLPMIAGSVYLCLRYLRASP
jgi:hypothetical protein